MSDIKEMFPNETDQEIIKLLIKEERESLIDELIMESVSKKQNYINKEFPPITNEEPILKAMGLKDGQDLNTLRRSLWINGFDFALAILEAYKSNKE